MTAASSPRINSARSQVITFFLDQTDGDWLWLVDTDMTFTVDAPQQLLATAKKHNAKLAAGLCFIYDHIAQKVGPNIFFKDEDEDKPWEGRYRRAVQYPRDESFFVDATGAACLLVHREVLVRMRETYPRPYHWFEEASADPYRENMYGPDIEFCRRAQELGYSIIYDSSVKLGHLKTIPFGEPHFEAMHRKAT